MLEEYDAEQITLLDVEREMVELGRHLAKAPAVIKEYHNKVRDARKAYKVAHAKAYLNAVGPQAERKMQADLATELEADALDVAEIEYKFMIDSFDALRTKLRALQSVGSMIKAEMFNPQQGGI